MDTKRADKQFTNHPIDKAVSYRKVNQIILV